MKVLVAHGSRMGGTEEIAYAIGQKLTTLGYAVTVAAADEVRHPCRYDAVVVGSSLYAGRWRGGCVTLLRHLARGGFAGPVWLFHSGPLGDEANVPQPFPKRVATLAAQLDVRGWGTFGGRLDEHPDGFIARAMAKEIAGDWRDWHVIDAWAENVAATLDMQQVA
jgi:menaquinone-dependent protoporphyrinogen oxidase